MNRSIFFGSTETTLENGGTYASHCLMARRLVERGVRFVQLFHRGWDQHRDLPRDLRGQCQATDRATAALILDLEQRGMLEDTLIVWGGEFGRTIYCQGDLTKENYGRDHHPRCFTMWLAGGGASGGLSYGETDDFSYNIVKDPVPVPRPERHHPASPGNRPSAADVQVPGPRPPADGRARQGAETAPGLSRGV